MSAPIYRVPGDGDEDLASDFAGTCDTLGPVFAAIPRHEGAAGANLLWEDGVAPAFALIVQRLAVPLAQFNTAWSDWWGRLQDHITRPGPRAGAGWRPGPDLVSPVREMMRLVAAIPPALLPILEALLRETEWAERALALLDRGDAVIDGSGNVVATAQGEKSA